MTENINEAYDSQSFFAPINIGLSVFDTLNWKYIIITHAAQPNFQIQLKLAE